MSNLDFFSHIDQMIFDNLSESRKIKLITTRGGKMLVKKPSPKKVKISSKDKQTPSSEIKTRRLDKAVEINTEDASFQSDTIMWDRLSYEELQKVLDNILTPYYPKKWERIHTVNTIINLYNISQREIVNIKQEMLKGNFRVSWIVPIVDDIKLVFNKLEEEGSVIIKLSDFEQQITDYHRSITNQNDVDNLIKAFSGFKNNLDNLNGINMPIRNNRMVYSYNSQEYRFAHDEEILKIIGLKIDVNQLNDPSFASKLVNITHSSLPEIPFNFKVNLKLPGKDEYFFNNQDEFSSALTIIDEVYNAFLALHFNNIIEYKLAVFENQSKKKFEDKTTPYKLKNKENSNEIIRCDIIKDTYTKYFASEYPELQVEMWAHHQKDNGTLYYLLNSFLNDNEKEFKNKADNIESLLKLKLENSEKEGINKELLQQSIDYVNLVREVSNYVKSNKDEQQRNFNELTKYYWAIINIIGQAKFDELLFESRLKNISIASLLNNKEKDTINLFLEKYDKLISQKTHKCPFDELRYVFDQTPIYDVDRKASLLTKILEKFAPKNKDGTVKLPEIAKKQKTEETQLIYMGSSSEGGSKECAKHDIACNHEVIMFIKMPSLTDDNEIRNMNTLIQQKYEIPNDDGTEFICRYCTRYIRMNLGENDGVEYNNDQLVMKTGVSTKTELSVLTKMNEYLNFIGRGDINGRELVEDIMPFINENIIKEFGTKNFELKKEIIELSFIIAILTHTIINHPNKYLNTSLFPVVNYTTNEIIKYFENITSKLFASTYDRIKSYKLDFFRITINRHNTLYENASFIAERKKRRFMLSSYLDYTKNIENMQKRDMLEKQAKQQPEKAKNMFDVISYLSQKYLNIYQNEAFRKKYLDAELIELKFENIDKVNQMYRNDINIIGISKKEVVNELKNILDKIIKFRNELQETRKQHELITAQGRNIINPTIDDKYETKIDERKNIIEYFIQHSLDGTSQEYTYMGYSLIDGRNITDITNPSEKEFKEMQKRYNELKIAEKKEVRELFKYNNKPLLADVEYKKMMELNEKDIMVLVDKILLKSFNFDEMLSSSGTSSDEDIIMAQNTINKQSLLFFMNNMGYYTRSKDEELSKITDQIKKEKREKELERERKDLIKGYCNELVILVELLKNPMNNIVIKNMKGLEKYEKYLEFSEAFQKLKLGFDIETINRISRFNDISDKKRGNILVNLLVNAIINNSNINQKVNIFMTEYLISIFNSYDYYDTPKSEKDNNYRKNENDIFDTIRKINNITDEDRIELDIDFIDLRKVNDPYEFVDVIKKVDDFRQNIINKVDNFYDGDDKFDDEEFEAGEFEL